MIETSSTIILKDGFPRGPQSSQRLHYLFSENIWKRVYRSDLPLISPTTPTRRIEEVSRIVKVVTFSLITSLFHIHYLFSFSLEYFLTLLFIRHKHLLIIHKYFTWILYMIEVHSLVQIYNFVFFPGTTRNTGATVVHSGNPFPASQPPRAICTGSPLQYPKLESNQG